MFLKPLLSADDVVRQRDSLIPLPISTLPLADAIISITAAKFRVRFRRRPGVEPLHVMGLATPKSRVDRIGADARRQVSFVRFALSDGGGYDVFTDGFLPRQNSMMAIRSSPLSWVSG